MDNKVYNSEEEFLKDYSREEIGYDLIYQKVSDFLYENAKFIEKAEEEYLAEQDEMYSEEMEEVDVEEEDAEEEDAEEETITEDDATETSVAE